MIIHRDAGEVVVVRQVDHQNQCATFARRWGSGSFATLPWAASLTTAAALHDEGWRAWERAPRFTAAGAPIDFPDIEREEHVALYRSGIDAACRHDPRAGYLVSLHGVGLYRGRLGLDHVVPSVGERPPAVGEFLAAEDRRRQVLERWIGDDDRFAAWSWAAYRLLQAWDLLSLVALWGRLAERPSITLRRVPRALDDREGIDIHARREGDLVRLAPWPFGVARLPAPVAARTIPAADRGDPARAAAALAAAPWRVLPLELRPG